MAGHIRESGLSNWIPKRSLLRARVQGAVCVTLLLAFATAIPTQADTYPPTDSPGWRAAYRGTGVTSEACPSVVGEHYEWLLVAEPRETE